MASLVAMLGFLTVLAPDQQPSAPNVTRIWHVGPPDESVASARCRARDYSLRLGGVAALPLDRTEVRSLTVDGVEVGGAIRADLDRKLQEAKLGRAAVVQIWCPDWQDGALLVFADPGLNWFGGPIVRKVEFVLPANAAKPAP